MSERPENDSDMMAGCKRVLVLSSIPGLKKAIEAVLPKAVSVVNIPDLEDETIRDFKKEVVVMDNVQIGPVLYGHDDKFAFVQVSISYLMYRDL